MPKTAIEHARKLRRISGRIARHIEKLAAVSRDIEKLDEAQRELCEALTEAANDARDQQLLSTAQASEVVAPKDDDGD